MNAESAQLHDVWTTLVAGWADHLDPAGANLVCDGIRNHAEQLGSYEGTTRMMWGLGSWVSNPAWPDSIRHRGREYNLRHLTRRALVNGTDPDSHAYWGDPASTGMAQFTVESGQVAFALWQTRARIWDQLSSAERDNIARWLVVCGEPPANRWRNNWALFWALNHTVRRALDLPHDQTLIDDVMSRYLDTIYCGDGWYDDGPALGTNHFDDYNFWVFASHVLAWVQVDPDENAERRGELLERVRQLMRHVPYFFAADGAYPEYGRSLAYKFARLGSLLWAYKLGAWPHSVGLLKTIVCRHISWYVNRGAIRADGTLRQSLTSQGANDIREPYISTGAPYWAMQAFGGLWSLEEDDPFWTAEQEPLPVERDDFVKVFPQPGWIVTGSKQSGAVHRFNAHSAAYPAKYSKFVYSTAASFNVGLPNGIPAPDAMFSLLDDDVPGHRHTTNASELSEQGWMRMIWSQPYAGTGRTIDTTIVARGDWQLRVHRIEPQDDRDTVPIPTTEGAAAHGYAPGDVPRLHRSQHPPVSAASSSGTCVAIHGWDDRRAMQPTAWEGAAWINSVWGRNVIPALSGEVIPGALLISSVYLGRSPAPDADHGDPGNGRPVVTIDATSTLTVDWHGERFTIPRPAD